MILKLWKELAAVKNLPNSERNNNNIKLETSEDNKQTEDKIENSNNEHISVDKIKAEVKTKHKETVLLSKDEEKEENEMSITKWKDMKELQSRKKIKERKEKDINKNFTKK